MLRGMALFEIGDVVRATEVLDEACLAAQGCGPSLECTTRARSIQPARSIPVSRRGVARPFGVEAFLSLRLGIWLR